MIISLQDSKEPAQRQAGQLLAKLEFGNAHHALDLSLAARESILTPYLLLSNVLDETKDNAAGLVLAERVTAVLEQYPAELLAGPLGLEMVGALDGAAKRFLLLKRYPQAKAAYERALSIHLANTSISPEQRKEVSASIYHQLGMVAEEQRQWPEAEQNYREALRIYVEFNDRYSQASAYHNFGSVAQAQWQWPEAEQNYREALRIYVEFNDQHNLGIVLRSLARLSPERPGLAAQVAEILGMTADQVQALFDAGGSPPKPQARAATAGE